MPTEQVLQPGMLQGQANRGKGPEACGYSPLQEPGILSCLQRQQFCGLGRGIAIRAPAGTPLITLGCA